MSDHKNATRDYIRAKELRRQSPLPERLLWNKLCESQKSMGLKFRRQYPLHPYIADFVCLKAKLVIELDGTSHDARQGYDNVRDTFLKNLGYLVLRFSNDDIKSNLEDIAAEIMAIADRRTRINGAYTGQPDAPSPNPSRKGRGTGKLPTATSVPRSKDRDMNGKNQSC